ncbi:helix-turn-helix transcriptional regulator [Halomonas denitrificans]|nr:helix-turn-helix transcriptional regulator [Halomonas denitrificans]
MVNRVRELRTSAGMTQQALADAVGVSRQTINAIETGRYMPSLEVALKIAGTFEAPTDEVFRLRVD